MDRAVGGAGGQGLAQVVRAGAGAVDDGREDVRVDLGESLGQVRVGGWAEMYARRGCAERRHVRQRYDVRGQPVADVREEVLGAGARPVDLVDEDERGQP